MGPRMLSVREVAACLRLSTATVYKAIRAGVIPAVRIVGQFRIPEAAVALACARVPTSLPGPPDDAGWGGT